MAAAAAEDYAQEAWQYPGGDVAGGRTCETVGSQQMLETVTR